MSLIPDGMFQVRVFAAREYRRRDKKLNRWIRIEEESDPPVDQQVNEWLLQSRAQLEQISSPQVNIYQQTDPKSEKQLIYVSVSVMYMPAVEGDEDDETSQSGSRGPLGPIPGDVKPGSAGSGDIYEGPPPAN